MGTLSAEEVDLDGVLNIAGRRSKGKREGK
jgi:hypothetical protein